MKRSEEMRLRLEALKVKALEVSNSADATIEEITNATNEIKDLQAKIIAMEDIEKALINDVLETAVASPEAKSEHTKELLNHFRTGVAQNAITTTGGGVAVVYKELAKKIVMLLRDRSSVFSFFNSTNIKGAARIPIQATSGNAVWADENADPTPSTEPTIGIVELGQNRLYKESAITQQMLNVEDLDLEAFLAEDISNATTDSVELGIFQGTGVKQPTGLCANVPAGNQIALAVRGTISVADLKKAKFKLKKALWNKAKWFMNADVLLLLDLLQDTTGRPLLQPDISAGTGYTVLGIPVETTDGMPSLVTAGAATLIILATPDAYHTNTQKDIALYVFRDSTFTRKGLVGYAADLYVDGKPKNTQGLASVVNKA